MKYCLNITHNQFTTGSRGPKLFNVSAILATKWCLVVKLSEYVKVFFLRQLLKVQVLIECWLFDLSGILDKVYLSLFTKFRSKSIQLNGMYQSIRILQLVGPIYRAPNSHLHGKKEHLRLVTKVAKRSNGK